MTRNSIHTVLDRVYQDELPNVSDLEYLLNLSNHEDIQLLYDYADNVRKIYCGDEIFVRGIVEFSSYCTRTCMYCGLNKYNRTLPRYRMTNTEIMDCVDQIVSAGIKTVVLQSGQDDELDTDEFTKLITEIKQTYDIAITLSLGEYDYELCRDWQEAGADRYLLKIETSDKSLYGELHPEMSYDLRLKCSRNLKSLGFQNGSGCIVGLKNQTINSLANDILFFKKEDFDMIGIGVFIAHDKTPLKNHPCGNIELALKMIALTRIVTKNTHMPAATSMGNIGDSDMRFKALQTGANVIMLNFTPAKYKKLYSIYPAKESSSNYMDTLEKTIEQMNRKLDFSIGDSLKLKQKTRI